jgi:hypothetical protein
MIHSAAGLRDTAGLFPGNHLLGPGSPAFFAEKINLNWLTQRRLMKGKICVTERA